VSPCSIFVSRTTLRKWWALRSPLFTFKNKKHYNFIPVKDKGKAVPVTGCGGP
jgi:hypothetical protein